MPEEPAVSVVVPTHSDRRWSSLLRTVESVRAQGPAEIVVVVDHNPALRRRARDVAERFSRHDSGAAFRALVESVCQGAAARA